MHKDNDKIELQACFASSEEWQYYVMSYLSPESNQPMVRIGRIPKTVTCDSDSHLAKLIRKPESEIEIPLNLFQLLSKATNNQSRVWGAFRCSEI